MRNLVNSNQSSHSIQHLEYGKGGPGQQMGPADGPGRWVRQIDSADGHVSILQGRVAGMCASQRLAAIRNFRYTPQQLNSATCEV
jgi:hypothetical protein